jgi:uncharacterized protein
MREDRRQSDVRRRIRHGILMAAMLAATGCSPSTQAPAPAVVSDLPIDRHFPATMEAVSIPVSGASMNGFFYLASGPGPHPIAVMLHGFPGYEQDRDLAYTLRRAGYDVLFFHYRGAWGSGGGFSFSGAIDDTMAAVAFARDAKAATARRADPTRIVLVGHSMGGLMALAAASRDPTIRSIVLISPWDVGKDAADCKASPKAHAECLQWFEESIRPLAGTTAGTLCAEAEAHADAWRLSTLGARVTASTMLVMGAREEGLEAALQPLVLALRRAGAPLETRVLPTDHAYSDQRIALGNAVVRWLSQHGP